MKHKEISHHINEKVLLRNHQLAYSVDAQLKELLLLYIESYIITNIKNKNVYELSNIEDNSIKGNYNAREIKPYTEKQERTNIIHLNI